jgi:hypothetical protein
MNRTPWTDKKYRRKVTKQNVQPQTFRVSVTLECGHWTSYTVSARRLQAYGDSAYSRSIHCLECYKQRAS